MRHSLLLCVVTGALLACGDSTSSTTTPSPAAVRIEALPDTLGVGDSLLVTATALDAAGTPLSSPRPALVSLTPSIVSVDPATGRLRALAAGEGRVRASIAGGPTVERATLVLRLVREVRVAPPASGDSVDVGSTFSYGVSTFDGLGAAMTAAVRWRSSDTLVVTVDSVTGVARVIGDGDASLIATADGVEGSAPVRAWLPRFASVEGFRALEIAETFGCQVARTSGQVHCWGSDAFGALGRGTPSGQTRPIGPIASTLPFVNLAVNAATACAFGESAAHCWGQFAPGATTDAEGAVPRPLPIPAGSGITRWESVVIGPEGAACAESPAHPRLWCWGTSTQGLLGARTSIAAPDTIYPRAPLQNGVDPLDFHPAIGTGHACFIRDTGLVLCWGAEMQNFTAVDTGTVTVPQLVPGVERAFRPVLTRWGTCTLMVDRSVMCWGRSSAHGEIPGAPLPASGTGPGAYVGPTRVTGIPEFVGLTASATTVCGITADARLWCWGENRRGVARATADGSGRTPLLFSRRHPIVAFDLSNAGFCAATSSASTVMLCR